jgi:uncharacterized membrane protein YbhN (UPF0104 family)
VLKNKSIKLIVKTLIGLVLFLWMGYSIYHQVSRQPNVGQTIKQITLEWNALKVFEIALVFLLMILNWCIEAIKWRDLLRNTEKFSIVNALQSVLTGLAVSIITPNRVGEYMGRILYLRNVNKFKGISVTLVGSFAQLIITGGFGLIGLTYYIVCIKSSLWLYILWASSLVLSILLAYVYFHLSWLVDLTTRFIFFQKIKTYVEIIKRFDRKDLVRILYLSLLRYLVYTVQFYLLLQIFLVEGNFSDLLFTIWLLFWAMAIVPTIAIAEIGIRGETALYFFLAISTNSVGIISSTTMLWFVNLILPALLGCLFIYKMKIYEDE